MGGWGGGVESSPSPTPQPQLQPPMKKSPVEFRPSLDVSLPKARRGIGLRSPLLTPDGLALHNKPTLDWNELLAEPVPMPSEVPIHVTDYNLPPLERGDLPCPPPKKVDDDLRKSEFVSEKRTYPTLEESPIALRHKPMNPGGDTIVSHSAAERSELRLSLFQDDVEFHDSLAKIAAFPNWEPLRNLGEEKPNAPEPKGDGTIPTRLFDDEPSAAPPFPFSPPSPPLLGRLSAELDSFIIPMPTTIPSAAAVPEVPSLHVANLSSRRRRFGPIFRRTVQRNVTKKDEAVAEEKIVDEIIVPGVITEHSLRVFEESLPAAPAAPGEVLLVADALTKSYYKGKLKIPVLKGVNFFVRDGEFVAIVGQSGSGKSTLLHLLGTLDNPESGTIHFDGRRIDNLAIAKRDQLRNHSIGFIFQFYHLLPELTTLENVLSPLMIRENVFGYFRRRREHIETAKRLLDRVGLSHRLSHKPSELSGGEMQRAAIARALVSEPRILLADEPTGNLDAQSAAEIIELLRSLNQDHDLTIVMVTHDLSVAQSADRIVRMIDGRVECR